MELDQIIINSFASSSSSSSIHLIFPVCLSPYRIINGTPLPHPFHQEYISFPWIAYQQQADSLQHRLWHWRRPDQGQNEPSVINIGSFACACISDILYLLLKCSRKQGSWPCHSFHFIHSHYFTQRYRAIKLFHRPVVRLSFLKSKVIRHSLYSRTFVSCATALVKFTYSTATHYYSFLTPLLRLCEKCVPL